MPQLAPVVLAAAAAIVLLAPTRADAVLPPDFAGVYSEDAFAGGAEERELALFLQRSSGAGVLRHPFFWYEIETAPGHYEPGRYDEIVLRSAAHGLRVLPFLVGAPAWDARPPPPGAPPAPFHPPADNVQFAEFAAFLVRRYGPGGELWSEHPEIPALPIHSWQIWNEPSLPAWWGGSPDVRAYADLLRAGRLAVKIMDPGAEVVAAGVPDSDLPGTVPLEAFLSALYESGAAGSFDVLALHPYDSDPLGSLEVVRRARQVMSRHGDRSPMWVTEWGWASGPSPSEFTVAEPTQAAHVGSLLRQLGVERHELGIRGAVLFKWRDSLAYTDPLDSWPHYSGVLRADGSPKPALAAWAQALAELGAEPDVDPCSRRAPAGATGFAGVQSPGLLRARARGRSCQLGLQASRGVSALRQPVGGLRSRRAWRRLDGLVADAARHGIRVVPVLQPRAARLLGKLARRYGRGGSLWRGRRRADILPIRAWQLGAGALSGHHRALNRYARAVGVAARALRRGDRRATLVSAPLDARLLGRLYAGRRTGRAFGAVATNLGQLAPELAARRLRRLRTVLDRHGQRGKRIWATGISVASAPGPESRVTVLDQARGIERRLRALVALRGDLRLSGFVYSRWRDRRGTRERSGLTDGGGEPKLALSAYSMATRGVR